MYGKGILQWPTQPNSGRHKQPRDSPPTWEGYYAEMLQVAGLASNEEVTPSAEPHQQPRANRPKG
eukprot:781203-Karenia_brevis.AAC.1